MKWHLALRVGNDDSYSGEVPANAGHMFAALDRPGVPYLVQQNVTKAITAACGRPPPSYATDLMTVAMAVFAADLRIPRAMADRLLYHRQLFGAYIIRARQRNRLPRPNHTHPRPYSTTTFGEECTLPIARLSEYSACRRQFEVAITCLCMREGMGGGPTVEREPVRDLRRLLKDFITLEGEYVEGTSGSARSMLLQLRREHAQTLPSEINATLDAAIDKLFEFGRLHEKLFQDHLAISKDEWERILTEAGVEQWHQRDAAERAQP
jgi:hypothetical protein